MNTDNFTTFLPISRFKSFPKCFQGFFSAADIFFQSLSWVTQSGQFVIFLSILPSPNIIFKRQYIGNTIKKMTNWSDCMGDPSTSFKKYSSRKKTLQNSRFFLVLRKEFKTKKLVVKLSMLNMLQVLFITICFKIFVGF